MTDPPTAAALAASTGMSERRLNAGFKALFGTPIFETLRNERLEHARMVLEKQVLPLKLVAQRVGYRHVTNFINAFRARYGTSPRAFADRSGVEELDHSALRRQGKAAAKHLE
jgi:AraC-like DNA-binding protein